MQKYLLWVYIGIAAVGLSGCAGISQGVRQEDNKDKKKVFAASSVNVVVNYDKYGNPQPGSDNKKGAKVFTASARNMSVSYTSDDYDYSLYNKGYLLPGDYNTPKEIIARDSIKPGSTNIYLKTLETGEEVLYMTLPGVVKGYKYSIRNGNVYLLKKNNNKYELWVYDYQRKGEKVAESADPEFFRGITID